jgi:hypothetical protein
VIEPALGLAAVFANDSQVMKVEAAASLGRDFGVDFKSIWLERTATVMTVAPA